MQAAISELQELSENNSQQAVGPNWNSEICVNHLDQAAGPNAEIQ